MAVALAAVFAILNARREAVRMRAMGSLNQLRLSLANYESINGLPPNREFRGAKGSPTLSWLAAVLPYVEQRDVYDKLDLNSSWDSSENSMALKIGKDYWTWFCKDGYFICPLDDKLSIWDNETGLPRGTLSNNPTAIALIAIPIEGVHPLQPYVITMGELKRLLKMNSAAVYIECSGHYDLISLVDDSVQFERRQSQ